MKHFSLAKYYSWKVRSLILREIEKNIKNVDISKK